MRQFRNEGTGNPFTISCKTCNRSDCDFDFTAPGDIVIFCKACGNTHMIFKGK